MRIGAAGGIRKVACVIIGLTMISTIFATAARVSGAVIFDEEFTEPTLGSDWVVNPGKGSYSLTDNPGYLRYIIDAWGWDGSVPPLQLVRAFSGDEWNLTTSIWYNMRPAEPTNNRNMGFLIQPSGPGSTTSIGFCRSVGVYDGNPNSNCLYFWMSDYSKVFTFPNTPDPLPVERWYFEIERNKDYFGIRASNDGDDSTFEFQAEYMYSTNPFGSTQEVVIQASGWYGSNDPSGYADIDCIKVTRGTAMPNLPPVAVPIVSPSSGSLDTVFTFDASASYDPDGNITGYDWTFGDGMTGDGVTVSHQYASEGDIEATLTVTDDGGLSNASTILISVRSPPPPVTHVIVKGEQGPRASAVTWDYVPLDYGTWTGHIVNNGLRSLVVDVYDNTTGVPDQIAHQRIRFAAYNVYPYGEVTTSGVTMSLSHKYSITMTPNGPKGSSCTVEDMFLGTTPVAMFTLDKQHMNVFVDASSSYDPDGTIMSYDWTFGDGGAASGVTATHIYATPGVYEVVLAVMDNDGFSDLKNEIVNIEDNPPTASFTFASSGLTVNVNASGSSDDYGIVNYTWNWGDGTTGSGVTASHTYAMAIAQPNGSGYIISGRGSPSPHWIFGYTYDADGVTQINGCVVTVTDVRTGESTTWDETNAFWDPNSNVYFVDLSELPSGWAYGDVLNVTAVKGTGIGWTEAPITDNPDGYDQMDVILHEVAPPQPMVVTITLTVTDTIGQLGSTERFVDLIPNTPPIASFTVTPASGDLTTIFTFDASGSSDAETPLSGLQVRWDWENDGVWDTAWSTAKQIDRQFASPGTYTVCLEVMDTGGLIGLASKDVVVCPGTGSWMDETLDTVGDVGAYTSIAVDSSNHVHISYYDVTNGDLRYATNAGGSWAYYTLDSAGDVGQFTSIATDSNNHVHISYFDGTNYDLKYAEWTGSGWSIETVDSTGEVGYYSSLALDSNGHPHIGYHDNYPNYHLKYAEWTGSGWSIETVDSAYLSGVFVSLALDSNEYPQMSYYDHANYDLKYVKWTGSGWSIETVDSAGNVGAYSSLALGSDGFPHISYWEGTNGYLKYAKWTGSAWSIETVDSAGLVGIYTSLALDLDGFPHISYWDSGNCDLKYAKWTGSGWNIETVDSVGNVGSYTSIAVDNDYHPHISYYDSTNGDLKYATNAGAGYAPHGVIWIYGNGGFTQDNGVTRGSGTQIDPYVIEGWEIDASGYQYAISIYGSSVFFEIANCNVHNAAGDGIYLNSVSNGFIHDNICSDNSNNGICLYPASGNTLTNNICSGNTASGILIGDSSGNTLTNNTCSDNYAGIYLVSSTSMVLKGNKFVNDGLNIYTSQFYLGHWNTHDIDSSNTVNGKPLYYYKDTNGVVVPSGAGQVVLANCQDMVVENQHLDRAGTGILMGFSSNNLVMNNSCSGNSIMGMEVRQSDSNTITNNIVDSMSIVGSSGIIIGQSSGNVLVGNNFSGHTWYGVMLGNSDGNTISNNDFNNNGHNGVNLQIASGNTITNNTFADNAQHGISLITYSNNNNIWNNAFYHNNGAGDTYDPTHVQAYDDGYGSSWNSADGYGNYWSDWTTPDAFVPWGIVDNPYIILGSAGAQDDYPLTNPFTEHNIRPVASFTVSITGLTVTADGSNSTAEAGIVNYVWDWGDGWAGSGETASHTYGGAGTYTITLFVTDANGLTGSTTTQVYVEFKLAELSAPHHDHGLDTNDDGLYDYLVVDVSVVVYSAGSYYVSVDLYDSLGNHFITSGGNFTYLASGLQTVQVLTEGITIRGSGFNGPYYASLYLRDAMWNTLGWDTHIAQPYAWDQFQPPPAQLAPPHSDHGYDDNSDGLYEYLAVEVSVSVSVAGNYTINANLYDIGGAYCIFSTGRGAYLDLGMQTVELLFEGTTIYRAGFDGPYLVQLYLNGALTLDNDTYNTQAYTRSLFQPPSAFQPPHSDHGLDTDGDGLLNYLVVDAVVNIRKPGTYQVSATLYDGMGGWIAGTSNYSYLDAGVQIVELRFVGLTIRNYGVDGPYRVSMSLYDWMWSLCDTNDYYWTAAYLWTGFEMPGAVFEPPHLDYGIDTSGDGLFDYLVIGASVSVSDAGSYYFAFDFMDANGSYFGYYSNSTYLNAGIQTVEIRVQGIMIYNGRFNGPFTVNMNMYDGATSSPIGNDRYTTSPYSWTEFQKPTLLKPPHSDLGVDTNGDGKYDYLVVDVMVDATSPGYYRISGYMYNEYGNWTAGAENYTYLDTGIHAVELKFLGVQIRIRGVDGPFRVDLELRDSSWMWLDSGSYMTAPYLWSDFQTPPAVFAPPHSDYGLDTDADGLYNQLVVDVNLDVTVAGTYQVNGYLVCGNISLSTSTYSMFNVGIQTVQFSFYGVNIRGGGADGPYQFVLNIYASQLGIWLDEDTYYTSPYSWTDFQTAPAALAPPYSDHGLDTNADGLYEYLVVEVRVDVAVAGYYSVYGSFSDSSWGWISNAYNNSYLAQGMNTLDLKLEGWKIHMRGVSGPLSVNLQISGDNSNWSATGSYVTSAYMWSEFSAPSSLCPPYSDYGLDTDSDGLMNYLVVQATVNVTMPGYYYMYSELYDQFGNSIGYASTNTYLDIGPQSVELRYDGMRIRSNGVDGPYHVVLILDDTYLDRLDNDNYTTAAYRWTEFEPYPALFGHPHSDYGIDTNGDGLYDYLVVEAVVNVTEAGYYQVSGYLTDSAGMWWIASTSNTTNLDVGLQIVTLRYNGIDIRNSGRDGPYTVSMNLYQSSTGTWMDWDSHNTSAYLLTDFQTPPAALEPPHSDHGFDTNGDGLYDFLVVEVTVNVTEGDLYHVSSSIYANNGMLWIASVSNTTSLGVGVQVVELRFDGMQVWNSKTNGPYLVAMSLYNATHWYWLGDGQYATSSYLWTEFQLPPASFEPPHSDYGVDTNSDGLFDELVVEASVSVTTAGYYMIEAQVSTSQYSWIFAYGSNHTYLEPGTNEVRLVFPGYEICTSGMDGPYFVWLYLGTGMGVRIGQDIYYTQGYSLDQFQASSAELTGGYFDWGLDTDGDGLYDYLAVEAVVSVLAEGDYSLSATLFDVDGTWVANLYNNTHLVPGVHAVQVNLQGYLVHLANLDGPYWIQFDLYITGGTWIGNETCPTQFYSRDQFEPPPAELAPTSNDYGLDTNGDGLYESLVVEVSVYVAIAGNYEIYASLMNDLGGGLTWAVNSTYLDAGLQTVRLLFPGEEICSTHVDGPYYADVTMTDAIGIVDIESYATQAFTWDQFQPPP